MFTRIGQFNKKGGPEERKSYLKELRHEFETTKSHECKKQVLANLANFAYDPINYEFIKNLRLLDIFLGELSGNSEELLHFAIGGLCNICLDPESREYIIANNGIFLVAELLTHRNEEVVLNALACIIYMITTENQHLLSTEEIVNKVKEIQENSNPRFKNLATVYLQDYCKNEV